MEAWVNIDVFVRHEKTAAYFDNVLSNQVLGKTTALEKKKKKFLQSKNTLCWWCIYVSSAQKCWFNKHYINLMCFYYLDAHPHFTYLKQSVNLQLMSFQLYNHLVHACARWVSSPGPWGPRTCMNLHEPAWTCTKLHALLVSLLQHTWCNGWMSSSCWSLFITHWFNAGGAETRLQGQRLDTNSMLLKIDCCRTLSPS